MPNRKDCMALPPEERAQVFRKRKPGFIGEMRWRDYSILVPWVNTENGPALLFEVRSPKLRQQPGEISFPGGGVERGETFPEAAVREAVEELLIPEESIEVFGPNEIFISSFERRLYSYIGRINDYPGTFSEDEVDHTFLVPYEELKNLKPEIYVNNRPMPFAGQRQPMNAPSGELSKGEGYPVHMSSYRILVYRWNGYAIWGMTARILEAALELIHEYGLEDVLSNPDIHPEAPVQGRRRIEDEEWPTDELPIDDLLKNPPLRKNRKKKGE